MVTGLFNAHFPIGRLRDDVDRLLGCVLDGIPNVEIAPARARTHPAITMWEDEESFHAELDIPGIKLEDVEVTVVGEELTIAGERKDACDAHRLETGATLDRLETDATPRRGGCGSFRRVIGLPSEVDAGSVSATLNLGVLCITLPKAEAAKPRKIEIKPLTA